MTTKSSSISPTPRGKNESAARWFYPAAALLLLALTIIGFQWFYFHGKAYPGRELTPPIRNLVILHGLVMSAWILLALLQPILVRRGNLRAHKRFGRIGTGLAVAVFILGLIVAIESTRVAPPDMIFYGLNSRQFMAVPLSVILAFGIFVFIGVWNRRRPDLHKPMMLLATLSAVSAAISRIDALNDLYLGTLLEKHFSAFPMALGVGLLLLLIKSILNRAVDRYMAAGLFGLTVFFWLTTLVAKTNTWDQVVGYLVG